jgi:transposase
VPTSRKCSPRPSGPAMWPIQAAGASVLYLPPYSPDLNPIGQLFAKLKAMLRSAAARTKDALWASLGQALDAFPEAECQNYLANCGYEFT